MDQILMFVGASSDTWDYAKTYLRIVCVSGLFVLIANCYSNVIRAEGQSGKDLGAAGCGCAFACAGCGSVFQEDWKYGAFPNRNLPDKKSCMTGDLIFGRKLLRCSHNHGKIRREL